VILHYFFNAANLIETFDFFLQKHYRMK